MGRLKISGQGLIYFFNQGPVENFQAESADYFRPGPHPSPLKPEGWPVSRIGPALNRRSHAVWQMPVHERAP
jgi:ribosomal protein S10